MRSLVPAVVCLLAALPPTCRHHARLRADRIDFLTPVAFEYDKAQIRPASFPILDEVAAILLAHPELRVEIQGHGKECEYCARMLTRDRAESVEDYLIQRGVEPARLTAQGYGASVPLVLPTTRDADRINRRIEIRILPPP